MPPITVRQVVFAFLLSVAGGVFMFTMSRLALVLFQGRKPKRAFGSWPARVIDVVKYFFLQMSVAREKASWHHMFLFWGFLAITLGSIEIFVNGVIPQFSYALLGETFNGITKILLDGFNGLVLLLVIYAVYRRMVKRPKLIPMNWDAALILGMIGMLCLSHFLSHSMHFVAHHGVDPRFAHQSFGPEGPLAWMPITAVFVKVFGGLHPDTAFAIHAVNYWIHVLILLFFLNYIPYSKHIHLLGIMPNIFFRNRGQSGIMPKLDLEDESQWGVGRYEQFDWKSLLDTYACTECARCSNSCPAMATDKPLSPMHLVLDIQEEMRSRGEVVSGLTRAGRAALEAGEMDGGKHGVSDGDKILLDKLAAMPPLIGGRIKEETLWSCTTCGACEEACPAFIEQPLKILEMRTNLVLEQGKQPAEWARAFRGMENNNNPWGIGADKRMDWAEGIEVPVMAEKKSAEYLVWVGCAGSFDDQAKKITKDWLALLELAGVDYGILGDEEGCTGDSARRAGNEFLFQMMAEANVETLKQYDVKKILTSCPHCYHTFKNEYPQFGGNYEVWHHSQFLEKLIKDGKLRAGERIGDKVVYHDPCYMGRWNDEYDAPRSVLFAATGSKPTEMERSKNKSFCCGAGGARMWLEEEGERVNVNRTEEAVATGAKVVATACPFCNVMVNDGTKHLNKDEDVEVLDIAQLLARSTGAKLKAKAGESAEAE